MDQLEAYKPQQTADTKTSRIRDADRRTTGGEFFQKFLGMHFLRFFRAWTNAFYRGNVLSLIAYLSPLLLLPYYCNSK